ncbi:MAG: ornithine cyclodeaminase family protein [Planctomycetota bacterium]
MVLVLGNNEIRDLLTWAEVINVCEKLLWEEANGTAWFSPRQRLVTTNQGILTILPGGAAGVNIMGTRLYSQQPNAIAAKRFIHELSSNSVNVVWDMTSAELLVITAGEWINTLRTTAQAAVGAKYLARKDSRRLGILGSGMLALGSLMTLKEVFPLELAKVYSRTSDHRNSFCKKFSPLAGFPVTPVNSSRDAVEDVDILVTATTSTEPVFDGQWLQKGTHVSCIGGYTQAGGRELDAAAMAKFDVLAVLNKEHTMKGGVGTDRANANFTAAVDRGVIRWEDVAEIADIMAERTPGRRDADEITLFDSRAMGAFDIALSYRAYQLAKERDLGYLVDWGNRPDPGW